LALLFYPHVDDTQRGSLTERIELLMEAAERFKAVILDIKPNTSEAAMNKRLAPRDYVAAYNWEEIAFTLREIRELPEGNKADKLKKAELLTKLAEVYEVLRAAKMSKLEAVRLALMSEANQLRNSSSQVA